MQIASDKAHCLSRKLFACSCGTASHQIEADAAPRLMRGRMLVTACKIMAALMVQRPQSLQEALCEASDGYVARLQLLVRPYR